MMAAWIFLKGLPRPFVIAAVASLALLAAMSWHSGKTRTAYDTAYAQGVTDTTDMYREAQAEADRLATVGVAVTTGKQAAISKESSDAYDKVSRDIDARAGALRVRHDAQATARRAPVNVDLPGTGQAPAEPVAAPAEDGLPWSIAFPLMIKTEKNQAQLNAILDELEKQDALAASVEE